MQTPNTEAGRLTEQIMTAVRQRLPEIKTYQYNAVYCAVLSVLEGCEESMTKADPDAVKEALRQAGVIK